MSEEERRRDSFTKEDRKLLKAINGTVARHDEEIFGSEEYHTPGLKKNQTEIMVFVASLRTTARVIGVLIAVLGISNVLILIRGG